MLRCQRPATEDRSLQIYLEEGRDGALGIQPPPECRPPRKIRKGEAETVAWPAVGGTGGDREECFLAPGHVQRWRLGWTRAIFCSTRFSATCWFGGNARFWSAVPMDIGPGKGGKSVPSCRCRSREGGPHVPCAVLVWVAMVSSLQITSRLSLNHSGPRSCRPARREEDAAARGGDDGQQAVLIPLSREQVS